MDGTLDRTIARIASNFGQKSPALVEEEKAVTRALNIYKYCAGGIKDKQYQWLLNDNAYFNRRNVKYNLTTRTLEPIAEGSEDRINVNKVKQLHRGIVSYLNREHPMIDIRPGTQSEQAYSKARKEQYLAEYWYDHLQMNKKIKLITGAGAKYGVGWAKIAWDDQVLAPTTPFKADDDSTRTKLKGEVMFEHCDTWEVLADPLATDKNNMRFIVHAMPRTLAELKNNKSFKNVELAADKKLSVSPYRNAQLNSQTINKLVPGDSGMETVMILEVFRRDYKEDGSPCIYKTVITESGVLLQDMLWPMDEFPFEYYQTDTASSIYESEGVIKDVRDLVRSMNVNASGVQEAVRVMGKLNWLVAKGSGVNVIRDKTGDFVEYNPNAPKPEQSHPGQLPQYVEQHTANLERWINDQGGTHDAFNGNSPYGRASGEAINKLQEGDSNALAMMRDNLDDFLARSYKLLFKTFKANASGDRYFRMKGANVLADAWIEVKPDDISVDDDVQVKSGTALPYSQSSKIQLVTTLFKEKIIDDPKVALRVMGLSEIDNVNGSEQLDIDRQTDELKQMINGIELDDPIIAEDHNIHIRVVDQYIKTPDFKKLKPRVQQIILDHRSGHVKLSIQLAKMRAAMQVEPIKRSETLMVRASTLNEFSPTERGQFFDKFAVQSDASEIQKRGGLDIQDPNAALNQAHSENTQMAEQGEPVHISPYDNHHVHLEIHNALIASDEFATLTSPRQNMIRSHVKQHEMMLMTQTPGHGLVPSENDPAAPMPDHKLVTVADKRRAMKQAAQTQAMANMPHQG